MTPALTGDVLAERNFDLGVVPPGADRIGPCLDGEGPRAFPLDGHIGGMLSPRFALMFETQINLQTVQQSGLASNDTVLTQSTAMNRANTCAMVMKRSVEPWVFTTSGIARSGFPPQTSCWVIGFVSARVSAFLRTAWCWRVHRR